MAYGLINADIHSDSQGGVLAPISSVMRNRIINGQMQIDQRNAGASVSTGTTGAAVYTIDRWAYQCSTASKFTVQQNAGSVTLPVGFSNYLGMTSTSAYSLGASDYFAVLQKIEGFNMSDLAWGTANAKTITISFQAYSSLTGTFGGSLRNNNGRYYLFNYSIPVANTWTTISVTIAGDTTGTWTGGNGNFVEVWFSLGAGSSLSGTAGSWSASNQIAPTGATSVVGTSGATFYITGVQLEKGSSATGFEYRQYGQELALCQRYYQTGFYAGAVRNSVGSTLPGGAVTPLGINMRTAPTAVLANQTGDVNGTANTLTTTYVQWAAASGGANNAIVFSYTLSAEL